jgi:site-specific DNA recombinase
MPTRRAVIYARLSVSSEKSVSIKRQIEACEKYAESRGWKVVGTFKDDGVSASTKKPENRDGWGELLASPQKYDAVIIWKLDRLARRTLDFLQTHEMLQKRNAGVVAVEDPVDMTTAQGRAFTTVLAAFAELEAANIGARVRHAQALLLRSGRVVGGTVPYGWHSVRNPAGPGLVLAQDPDHIGYVRAMVDRVQRGNSIYSVVQWLNEVGAPTSQDLRSYRRAMAERAAVAEDEAHPAEPECSLQQWLAEKGGGTWAYTTVEGVLRNPILAGLTSFNPSVEDPKPGKQNKNRGPEVLHGNDGLPKVDDSLAIVPLAEWRAMLARLDAKDTGHSKPRAIRSETSPLLSGLMWCGEHGKKGVRMYRCAEGDKRHGYTCPKCHQTITSFEPLVIKEFLRQKGERVRWTRVEHVVEGGAAILPEIEHRLAELTAALKDTDDDERADALTEQIGQLRALRREKREESPKVSIRYDDAGWFEDEWEKAGEDVGAQRAVLDDAMERIWVRRGGTGRRTEAQVLARLTFDWKIPEDLGPVVAE